MEKGGEETGTIQFQEYANSDFGIVDFMDNEANLDQFIDLIQGQKAADTIVNFSSQFFDFDQQHTDHGGCLTNDHVLLPEHQLFDFDDDGMNHVARISPDRSAVDKFQNDVEERDEEESSATTTNTSEKKRKKSDRSRTLISERRRRGRMKEKLYALRSLVPNITKMDKASIVGDAVLYVQELQMQANKLKSEIAGLESSFKRVDDNKIKSKKMNATSFCPNIPIIKKILKMDVFQVEERGFYARIVSKKGKGVAVLLYKALESLTRFSSVKSSNLATDAENYVLTCTLHVAEEMEMNLPSDLKMWVARAFLDQGFDFETFPFS